MLRKTIFVFCMLLISGIQTNAQNEEDLLVDYHERLLLTETDSLLQQQSFQGGTYGILDDAEYIVQPGDQFLIVVKGIKEQRWIPNVDIEGYLYLNEVGAANVANKSLHDAKAIIDSLIRTTYKNVDIFVSLQNAKMLKVGFYGDVRRPSIYTLQAPSRLSDLFSVSSGIHKTADIRNIKIIRASGDTISCDFLAYMRLGKMNENPMLQSGDFVFLPKIDKTVSIAGNVPFEGDYEFREGESIYEFITLVGSPKTASKLDSIEVIRFDDNLLHQFSRFYSFKELQTNQELLKNKDIVVIRKLPKVYDEYIVYITGKVYFPGPYHINEDSTKLSEVIAQAGGLLNDASPEDATLTRYSSEVSTFDPEFERLKQIPVADMTEDEYDYYKSKSRLRKGKVVVDFVKLLKDKDVSEDIYLKKKDRIHIPEQRNYINLIGQVVSPGKLPFNETYSVTDYIELAGGYGWRALEDEVRIIRANTGEWVDAEDVEQLKPGDTIWIPEDPPGPKFWDVFNETLSILGQVATVVAATVAVIVSVN